MQRLRYMVGDWHGEGWILTPDGRRMAFAGSERVQQKLDGLALLVEGAFAAPDSATGREVPVHATLGVIAYDPRTSAYRFDTWLASGIAAQHRLEVEATGWRWQIETPAGPIRYSMTLTPDGAWSERGERAVPGGTWEQFFAMHLRRR